MEGFAEVRVIEVFYSAPEAVIGISTFGKKAVDMGIPFERAPKGVKDTNKARNEIFRLVQGEKEFFNDIRNRLKKTVKQVTVFKEKMAEGFVNGKDKVSVSAVDELKGHGSRPVIGILGTTGRAELRVATERNKFEIATMRSAIHGPSIGRITAVDDLFDVFHDNRSGLNIIFNDFIIIFQHLLYYVHEIIMKENEAKNKPYPSRLRGRGVEMPKAFFYFKETLYMPKIFLSYDQQIEKLKNEKNLQIDDEAYAKEILRQTSYYSLIGQPRSIRMERKLRIL